MLATFLKQQKYYKPCEIDKVLKILGDLENVRGARKTRYYNVPVSFDIETSSFYYHGEKAATMYEWSFCINGISIIGRSWQEFITMCGRLVKVMDLSIDNRLIIYVHNLAYEFQFMRLWFKWYKVFALTSRTPVYAITEDGLEFRCSYILSGYSLAKVGEHLQKYKVSKMVGDLDYSLLRHSKTHLTDKELGYCINDVKVVVAYIQELIDEYGVITKIPLTKTGFVRRYCRDTCLLGFNGYKYRELMQTLTMDPEEYMQLKRAFQGGFTHAGTWYAGTVQKDVTSFDFTSSYPTVMISEKFPMAKAERITIRSRDEFSKNIKLYCCIFDAVFYGLKPKIIEENYISVSRTWDTKGVVVNNGRIVSADRITTTITEQDFLIIQRFYSWDKIKIYNFKRYKKDYLPKEFIQSILTLYQNKTRLKGVTGKEVEYLHSKEMLNSCYGMAVTDPVRDEYIYNDGWSEERPEMWDAIQKYNKSRSRFLFYPWGVWVTAYARKNLFSGIMASKEDYIYSDTDSIKILNGDKHMAYIEGYNQDITKKIRIALKTQHIPYNAAQPMTVEKIRKPLGVWDFDGKYSEFKTLGAKRYMVRDKESGKVSITVSGLNKKVTVPYLIGTYGDNIFSAFADGLYIPADYTGKMTHTYIDDVIKGTITDYRGHSNEFYEKSYIHLEKADYSLSLAQEYIEYLEHVQEDEW